LENIKIFQENYFDIDLDHSTVVIMHAWNCGDYQDFSGWYRHVEYIPRASKILNELFPNLVSTVRSTPMRLFHVVSHGEFYKKYPGYQIAERIAKKASKSFNYSQILKSTTRKEIDEFLSKNRSGEYNQYDINRGLSSIDFHPNAKPIDSEPIAEDSCQLFGLCKKYHIDHLIYTSFAINWCLLLSPGGMVDMSRCGILCSTIRECVMAVENNFTARNELCKEVALWRVALVFGLVFNLTDFITSLRNSLL
jgi:hypothetical protein